MGRRIARVAHAVDGTPEYFSRHDDDLSTLGWIGFDDALATMFIHGWTSALTMLDVVDEKATVDEIVCTRAEFEPLVDVVQRLPGRCRKTSTDNKLEFPVPGATCSRIRLPRKYVDYP